MARKSLLKRAVSSVTAAAIAIVAMPVIPAFAEVGTVSYSFEGYDVEYSVKNEWTDGQSIEVKITNTGDEPILNWAFKYDAEGVIDGLWNASVYDSQETSYIIKNVGWNYEIAPDESVSFGYTLSNYSGTNPDNFELCAKRVDKTDGYDVQYNITNEWDTGLQGEIVIVNTSEEPIEAWELSFNSSFVINNLWNGRITTSEDDHYIVASEMWSNPINCNESVRIGFFADKPESTNLEISNFALSHIVVESNTEPAETNIDENIIDMGYIEKLIEAGKIEVIRNRNGCIRTIDGEFTKTKVLSPKDAAAVLNKSSKLFGDNFVADAANIQVNEYDGDVFFKYNSSINGIPVLGSQIILSTKKGKVTGLFSSYDNRAELINVIPDISEASAAETAISDIAGIIENYISDYLQFTRNDIIDIFNRYINFDSQLAIYTSNDCLPELIWIISLDSGDSHNNVDVDSEDNILISICEYFFNTYFISAAGDNKGMILNKECDYESYSIDSKFDSEFTDPDGISYGINDSYIESPNELSGYYILNDKTRNIETYKTSFKNILGWTFAFYDETFVRSDDGSWSGFEDYDLEALFVHHNMAKVYDYYKKILNWKSFDNNGAIIKSYTDYINLQDEDDRSAFYSRNKKFFVFPRNGWWGCEIDVVAHEYTHAVIDHIISDDWNRGLNYKNESGALEESLSDIMGCLAEGEFEEFNWSIAEDIKAMPIRILSNPSTRGQADHYSEIEFGSDDNGNVHKNSGIFSYAVYKIIDNDQLTRFSNEDWAKLIFKSMFKLTTNATFLDARGAILSTSKDMEFNDYERTIMCEIFDSVGITEPSAIRIILEWGDNPRDLDAHLTGPKSDGSERFHVYYGNRTFIEPNLISDGSFGYTAHLDYDVRTSKGPEIITLFPTVAGDYYFYVHDYTNNGNRDSKILSNSNATVKIVKGTTSEIIKQSDGISNSEFKVPVNINGTVWKVFKISVDNSGSFSVHKFNTLEFGSIGSLY